MKVLGLTSAMRTVGASVVSDNSVLSESTYSGKTAQSEKLVPLVEDVLKRTKTDLKDLDAVSVAIGPGSYSGLRGGLAAAKALVSVLKIPIIAVSTTHAIAYNLIDSGRTIAVAVNAMRDEYNFALFGSDQGKLERLTDDLVVKLDKIAEVFMKIEGDIMLISDSEVRSVIKNENIKFAGPGADVAWARNVALIGIEKLKNKEISDFISLSPQYSHKPNIREFKK